MKTTLISLRLRLDSPGGVSAPEAVREDASVLPLRTDTTGTPHLPGSTVAGSLRAHCRPIPELAGAFGGEPGDPDRGASPVQILGTVYRPAGEPTTRRRTSVNRERGAADNNHLHGIEQLPAGTEFDVVLRWNDPTDQHIEALLAALHDWAPALGRGTSSGAGRCRTVALARRDYDLTTPHGLLDWLTEDHHYPTPEPVAAEDVESRAVIDVRLRIVDGLHLGTGDTTPDEAGVQVARVHRQNGVEVVPGSSLKGVLRSRAEYICRVLGLAACLDQRCGDCRPCGLFGFTTADGRARRARIAVHDSTITDAVVRPRQHVALDRFTGGARPSALYTLDIVTSGVLRLRVEPLDVLAPGDVDLLHAVLCDLDDGLVGIGARTTSGLGTVRIDDPDWRRPDLTALAAHLTNEAP